MASVRVTLLTLVIGSLQPIVAAAQSVSSAPQQPTAARSAPTNASSRAPVAGYLIVDLTADPKEPDTTQIASFRGRAATGGTPAVVCRDISAQASYSLKHLAQLVACAGNVAEPIGIRAAAATAIKRLMRASVKSGTPRLISNKGEVVTVVVIDRAEAFSVANAPQPFAVRGRKPKMSFDEKARESQFVSDLQSLAQVVSGIVGAEAGVAALPGEVQPPVAVDWPFVLSQQLRLKRATATVTVERGAATAIQQTQGTTEEIAAQAIERWEAAQVKSVACTAGMPDVTKTKSTPFAVLLCQAQSHANTDLQVSAIEGLGTLGDARAASVLTTLAADALQSNSSRVGSAALSALAQLKAPPAAAARTEPAEAALQPKAELLTGPVEHWFLSADVPVNDVQAFSYDEDTNQVSLGDEPSAFYIGINFLIGDIKEMNRPFLGNLVFKAMVKASTHPLDSLGVAIGLRGQYFTKWGVNLDALTPFIGWTMTQEDLQEDGVVVKRARRNSELRVGVSLNLDQAIKWVGGS